MPRTLRWALFVAVLSAGLAFAAPASAGVPQSFILLSAGDAEPQQRSASPAGDFGGDQFDVDGLVLDGVGPPGCDIPYCDVIDPDLGADGTIVGGGPYSDCFAEFHYHGDLFNEPDPAPTGCGWGAATPFEDAPPEAQAIATVITLLTAAEAEKPRAARADLKGALGELQALQWQEGIYRGVTTDAELLESTERLAKKAKKLFKKASRKGAENKGRLKRKARKKIEKALVPAREYFERHIAS